MSMRIFILVFLLLLPEVSQATTFSVCPAQNKCCEPCGCPKSCGFTSIQDAVNAASPGDTILVHCAYYNEKLLINKKVDIRGSGMPTIFNTKDSDSTVILSVDGITFEGFEVRNSKTAGIYVTSDRNTIKNNVIKGRVGIYFNNSNSNIFSSNLVANRSLEGVRMVRSRGNTIEGNVISDNLDGIAIYALSNNNIISTNVVARNDYQGILICHSDGLKLTGNRVFGNYYGIYLSPSNGSVIRSNDISNNGYAGLEILDGCMNSMVSGNTINANLESGVNIYGSSGNWIKNNVIRFNKYGLTRAKAKNNFIYGNSITDNWSANLHDWT